MQRVWSFVQEYSALLVLGAITAAFLFVLRRPMRSALTVAEKSVAVLPFENLSGDPEQTYLAAGIAGEIRNILTRIAGLKVAGSTSSEVVREDEVSEKDFCCFVSEFEVRLDDFEIILYF